MRNTLHFSRPRRCDDDEAMRRQLARAVDGIQVAQRCGVDARVARELESSALISVEHFNDTIIFCTEVFLPSHSLMNQCLKI